MSAKVTPKKILLIRTDRIGDVVLTIPAVSALREQCPGVKISLLISPFTLDLVKGFSAIDEILIDDRKGRHKGFTGFLKLVNEIRARQFDAVINFHTKKRTNLLCFLARIPRRIGYKNNKFGFLLTEQVNDIRPEGRKHEAQYCLDLLRPLGVISRSLQVSLPRQEEAEQWADGFLKEIGEGKKNFRWIALHPGASCPTKRWPIDYFATLIKKIQARYPVSFLLIGTADQQSLADDLKNKVVPVYIHDTTGKLSLAQMVSLLRRCDLLISSDSGPVHVASATDTPVVSIFTRNQPGINPERWGPLGPRSFFVAPPVDMTVSFAKGEVKDDQFLYFITPEQVLTAVDGVFQV